MKNIITITKREFITQVKKKYFIILTLLAPLLIVAAGTVITLMIKANETEYRFGIIDKSGWFEGKIIAPKGITYLFKPESSEKEILESLKKDQILDGVLVIPKFKEHDFETLQKRTKFLINTKISFETKQKIAFSISEVIREEKIRELGLTKEQIKGLERKFELFTENVLDSSRQDSDLVFGVKSALSFFLMYIIFMFIVIYGVRIMRSVLEEKNNRIVEIIISSVKPFELMMGKIFGVTLVAITQFLIWISMGLISVTVLGSNFPGEAQKSLQDVDGINHLLGNISHILLSLHYGVIFSVFIIYFILGYLFYSAMYAAIGSAMDNETETQQFTVFAILPLSLGLYGSIGIMNNPDGPIGFWLSMIPFTSPVAMVARIPFGIDLWEIVLSIGILAISTVFMVFIAGKIYRIGILMYGNKITLKELWKWLKS